MAGEPHAVVDALPYYDRGYDEPGVKDAVIAVEFHKLFLFIIVHITRLCVAK